MSNGKHSSKLFTRPEAARYLKLSPSTLEKWITQKKGPPVHRLVGAIRYTQRDLDDFVEADPIDDETANSNA